MHLLILDMLFDLDQFPVFAFHFLSDFRIHALGMRDLE